MNNRVPLGQIEDLLGEYGMLDWVVGRRVFIRTDMEGIIVREAFVIASGRRKFVSADDRGVYSLIGEVECDLVELLELL